MQTARILVVGGGIVGLTLARELLAIGHEDVVVLEKEPRLGAHASGRNSGVLHAGIYYAPDSAKARTCLAGNRLLRAYCREKGLPLAETGKVIVARDLSEHAALDALHRRAVANGAEVAWLDERELAEVEPNARTVGKALLSRLTAVVDPLAVLGSLRSELEASGRARLVTGCAFLGLDDARTARTSVGPIRFERLVNAAGAHCVEVARAFGLAGDLRLVPFKGIYRKFVPAGGSRDELASAGAVGRRAPSRTFELRGSIYPVPDARNPFLGVHFTRGVHGDVYVGPTAIPALGPENYGLFRGASLGGAFSTLAADAALFVRNAGFRAVALTEPRKYLASAFHRDAARLVKRYDPAEFARAEKVGIRPQLVDWRTKALVMDFLVQAKDGTVHVLNPISPAFTSSMALARQIVAEHFTGRPSSPVERTAT